MIPWVLLAYNLEFSKNSIKKLISKKNNCSQHTIRLMLIPVNFRKALLGSSLLFAPKHKCYMLKGVLIGPRQLNLNLLPGCSTDKK